MTEVEAINKYKDLHSRAMAVGLSIATDDTWFDINNTRGKSLTVSKTLEEIDRFLYGYESGLKAEKPSK